MEGVLDIAFEDADGWTVVDFKIDAEMAGARATGKNVTAVLMQL